MMREETDEACPGMVLRPGGRARVGLSTRGSLFELLRLSGVCPLEYRGDMDTMTRAYLIGLLKSAGSRYSYGNADFLKETRQDCGRRRPIPV